MRSLCVYLSLCICVCVLGIMPHEDGPMYYPTVSTISLGSHTLLDFYEKTDGASSEDTRPYVFSLYIEPRSLVVLQQDMYKAYLHGIREVTEDSIDAKYIWNLDNLDRATRSRLAGSLSNVQRTTRVSLTIRYVPKTIRINLNSLLSNKRAK